MFDTLSRDLRHGWRSLRSSGGVTVLALLSLAVGTGVNTTAFSILNALAFRGVPGVERQDRLVALGLSVEHAGGRTAPGWLSYPDFSAARELSAGLAGLAAAGPLSVAATVGDETVMLVGEAASGSYFSTLGARPVLGRFFDGKEDVAGNAKLVAVLAHDAWQDRFGGDSSVVGRTLTLNRVAFTIVGIAGKDFVGMTPAGAVAGEAGKPEFWVPVTSAPVLRANAGRALLESLEERWLRAVARLPDGVPATAAGAALEPAALHLRRQHPEARAGAQFVPGSLVFGPGRGGRFASFVFVAFMIVPALVLLVACANVANLLLARGVARRREMAIRLATGAQRRDLIRQLLTEGMLLGLGGGAAGLLVAFWAGDLARLVSLDLLVDVPLDLRVLGFTLLCALGTAVVFATAPALRATRVDPLPELRGERGGRDAATSRLRHALLVAQVATAFVLLVACGLFVRSTLHGLRVDSGLDETRLLLVSVDLDLAGYPAEARDPLFRRLAEALRDVPGVTAVGSADLPPLGGLPTARVAQPAGDLEFGVRAGASHVGDDYFHATGVQLRGGRFFGSGDAGWPPRTAVVSETLARRLWPDGNVSGRQLRVDTGTEEFLVEVVGQAADTRAHLLHGAAPLLYLPRAGGSRTTFYVRTVDDPAGMAPRIRDALRRLDPHLPVPSIETVRQVRERTLAPWRLLAAAMGLLGAIALLLATAGLYGVMAYAVAQQRREIGIQMALGATRARIMRSVLLRCFLLLGAGLLLGGIVAGGIAILLRSALFGVEPLDPLTFAGIALLLATTALLAAALPARTAAGVQPLTAIREG